MKTIRRRLLVMMLTGLGAAVLLGGAAVYWISRTSLIQQFDAALEARAHTVASLVKFEPWELVFEGGDAPTVTMEHTYFELRTSAGELLKRSENLGESAVLERSVEAGPLEFADVQLPEGVRGRAAWLTFEPRVDRDDWEGLDLATAPESLVVAVALDRGPVDRALARLLGSLLVVGAALGVIIGTLVLVGVRFGLAPLDRLTEQLGRMDGRTISNRLDDDEAPGELLPVYRELNGMLDRVEATLDRERSFASAAAHELRTPLAELRSTAEVAIRWPDADRARAALGELRDVGAEMEAIVESLLLISRGSADAIEEIGPGVPLKSMVHICLERLTGTINEKHLHLDLDLHHQNALSLPRRALEIILRNLIDNAVEYTPPGGRISISDRNGDVNAALLVIENTPVILTEEDLPDLFQPFWRKDESRSDRKHTGLGLAVVDRITRETDLRLETRLQAKTLQFRLFHTPGVQP